MPMPMQRRLVPFNLEIFSGSLGMDKPYQVGFGKANVGFLEMNLWKQDNFGFSFLFKMNV